MSRVVPAGALLIFLLALATAGGAAGSSPQARAAGSCHLSSYEQRHLGASYVTSLSVSNTSCKTGKAVVRSYHRNGGHVSGWSCHRRILDKSPAQYDARATCTRGSKRVVHTYTKNT
ncbi:MAG: hypothetical protein QOC95_1886 [Thermoleophilaceae bacterium]|jgi:hypothetical protein|nr:hypothetical protein [Thermoleophilaceae bacterium]